MNQDVTILDCSATSLEGDTMAPWRDAIVAALEGGAKKLLIDLSGVENFGDDAANALLNIQTNVYRGEYDARIALLTAGQRITATGHPVLLDDTFVVWTSESEAVERSLAKWPYYDYDYDMESEYGFN
jgi:hypothetical protein